jgi:hypothetical protein
MLPGNIYHISQTSIERCPGAQTGSLKELKVDASEIELYSLSNAATVFDMDDLDAL